MTNHYPRPNAPAGLTERASSRFASPKDQADFDFLRAKLFNELLPAGIEELSQFERHAFCLFMLERSQSFEAIVQEKWIADPDSPVLALTLERLQRYRRNYERDADRAYKNLTQLQADRILRAETNQTLSNELNADIALPPVADISQLLLPKSRQSNVITLATRALMESAQRHLQQNPHLRR
jgi:hypothetical protein